MESLNLKHPLEYTSRELNELMFKPLRFHVGKINSDQIDEIVIGKIIQIGIAANPPHLPTDIVIRLNNHDKIFYNLFQVKAFSQVIENEENPISD